MLEKVAAMKWKVQLQYFPWWHLKRLVAAAPLVPD
jgi:hypothetical protein